MVPFGGARPLLHLLEGALQCHLHGSALSAVQTYLGLSALAGSHGNRGHEGSVMETL